jgi:DNA mismatch endonuclease, patch repair protein
MPDILSPEARSALTSRIRGRDTKPEMAVRKLIHRLGYRYRLHRSDLPGKPDLVFRGRKKIVLVHGCFWHGHTDPKCKLARTPKSNVKFWTGKVVYNRARDARNIAALEALGWRTAVVWECELKDIDAVQRRLVRFLGRRRG